MRFGFSLTEPAHLLAVAIRVGVPFEFFIARGLHLSQVNFRFTASSSEQLRTPVDEFELVLGDFLPLALFRPDTTGRKEVLERAGAISQRCRKSPERTHRLARRHASARERSIATPLEIGIEAHVDLS